jgi:hypothetical protein
VSDLRRWPPRGVGKLQQRDQSTEVRLLGGYDAGKVQEASGKRMAASIAAAVGMQLQAADGIGWPAGVGMRQECEVCVRMSLLGGQ